MRYFLKSFFTKKKLNRMTYDRYYLYNAYNATSTNNDQGELESYKEWLERQLLSRIKEANKPPKTPLEIATKYVKGQHDALTDNQEIKDLAREIEAYKNQPPKLRPMSELPELNEKHYLFAYAPVDNLKEVRYVSLCRLNPVGVLASWNFNFKTNGHLSLCRNYILVGWLYELPNPNDIKL